MSTEFRIFLFSKFGLCLNLDVGLCPVVLSNWQPLLWNGFGLGRKIRQGPYVSRPINRRCIQRTPVWFHQAVIYPSNRKQLSVYDLMCKPHTPSAALGLGGNYQSRLSWHPSNVNPDAETHCYCSCYLDMQITKKFCPSKKRRGWYYLNVNSGYCRSNDLGWDPTAVEQVLDSSITDIYVWSREKREAHEKPIWRLRRSSSDASTNKKPSRSTVKNRKAGDRHETDSRWD